MPFPSVTFFSFFFFNFAAAFISTIYDEFSGDDYVDKNKLDDSLGDRESLVERKPRENVLGSAFIRRLCEDDGRERDSERERFRVKRSSPRVNQVVILK